MHPYHLKEYVDERQAEMHRSARRHQIVAEARASLEGASTDTNRPPRRSFRIPGFNWLRGVQPARPVRHAR